MYGGALAMKHPMERDSLSCTITLPCYDPVAFIIGGVCVMQILNRSVKLSGAEKEDVLIGVRINQGVVLVLENRGPSAVEVIDIGVLEPNKFVVIGSIESIKLRSTGQFTTIDVTAFTC
jgi:hypothetical protein